MAIDPLGRSPSPRPDPLRPDPAREDASAPAQAGTDSVLAADTLALSPEALVASRQEQIPTGELTTGQLDTIRQRLASGYYESPEVTQRVSEHVAREIELPIAWGGLG